jgi:hypothetical protein
MHHAIRRLHNMRTVYALKPDRQRAVATETMQVWCSLAERLGMFALKASHLLPLSHCASCAVPHLPQHAQLACFIPCSLLLLHASSLARSSTARAS